MDKANEVTQLAKMAKKTNQAREKFKVTRLNVLVLLLCLIFTISFGVIVYKGINRQKTVNYLEALNNLPQGDNFKKSKRFLTKVLGKVNNKSVRAAIYSKLGFVNLSLGDYWAAAEAYKNAYDLYPDNPETSANLGLALGKIGKRDEAIRYLNIAKKLKPKFAQVYNNLGIQLAYKEKTSQAIASFKKAIKIDQKCYRAYTNLSTLYFGLGDYENSKAYINLAIENGANNIPTFKKLLQEQLTELKKYN